MGMARWGVPSSSWFVGFRLGAASGCWQVKGALAGPHEVPSENAHAGRAWRYPLAQRRATPEEEVELLRLTGGGDGDGEDGVSAARDGAASAPAGQAGAAL